MTREDSSWKLQVFDRVSERRYLNTYFTSDKDKTHLLTFSQNCFFPGLLAQQNSLFWNLPSRFVLCLWPAIVFLRQTLIQTILIGSLSGLSLHFPLSVSENPLNGLAIHDSLSICCKMTPDYLFLVLCLQGQEALVINLMTREALPMYTFFQFK